jgi:hypothetical protein
MNCKFTEEALAGRKGFNAGRRQPPHTGSPALPFSACSAAATSAMTVRWKPCSCSSKKNSGRTAFLHLQGSGMNFLAQSVARSVSSGEPSNFRDEYLLSTVL